MAGATELIGNVFLICNIERLVNPVTGHTVGKSLPFKMRFMAFHAVGDVAVLIMMADCAVETTMGTGVVFYFINLGRVTGVADGNVIFAKDDMQGLVWVLMTTEAGCFHFKVGFSLMTFGALGDNIFLRSAGGMSAFMAVKTAYFCFMACTVVLILMDDFWMTFYTVAVFQYRIPRPDIAWCNNETDGQKKGCREHEFFHNSPF